MKSYLFLIPCILIYTIAIAGSKSEVVPEMFEINIFIKNRDTGKLKLLYPGEEKVVELKNGKASFLVGIANASEMLLFTDPNARNLDDSSIIRFLAEPSNMTISFSIVNGIPDGLQITGSGSQKEKEKWEMNNAGNLKALEVTRNAFGPLLKRKGRGDSILVKKKLDSLDLAVDSIYKLIGQSTFRYVGENPDSYFSGYLLYKYHRRISQDSLQTYYLKLSPSVKLAHFSVQVFDYLFTLLNRYFRQQHDRSGIYAELNNAESLFDFVIPDVDQKPVKLSRFKGKPTLLFFWATWCGPCHKQAPYLEKVIREFKNDSINFVSVSLDRKFEQFKKSDKKINLPCTTLVDANNELRYFYQFLYVPHLILLDHNGKVIINDAPSADSLELRSLISAAIKQSNLFILPVH